MKSTTIIIPEAGTSVSLILNAGIQSGQAVIVTSDGVEVRFVDTLPQGASAPKSLLGKKVAKASGPKLLPTDHGEILKRLIKLNTTTRTSAVNSIMTMFQFHAPITSEDANIILETLRQQRAFTIDANGKLKFTNT